MGILLSFLKAFLLTALIEAAVMFLLFRKPRFSYYTFLCNLLTNPLLNLLLLLGVYWGGVQAYVPLLVVLEIMAVFAEAVILRMLAKFAWPKAIWVSALLNGASLLAGLLLNAL